MAGWKWMATVALLIVACTNPVGSDAPEEVSPQPKSTQAAAVPSPTPTSSPTPEPVATNPPQKPSEAGIELPRVDPLKVEGNISIAGSSTVFPLSQRIYERFIEYGYAGQIKIDRIGSGAGFQLFCQKGKSDIVNASRPINNAELQICAAIDRKPIEFRIGTDAIAIAVNPENQFISNVTREELAALFRAEKWSDVNPDWPDKNIERFVPGEDSGTFEFFVEKVLDNDKEKLLAAPNTELTEDDDYITQNIASRVNSIGFLGYAYYERNRDTLKVLSLEGIEPTAEVVENGNYLLARPLLIYSDANIMRKKPQVGEFINFYLSLVAREIEEVGYFPSPRQTLEESKKKFLEAIELEKRETN